MSFNVDLLNLIDIMLILKYCSYDTFIHIVKSYGKALFASAIIKKKSMINFDKLNFDVPKLNFKKL
jgi:hypothetical protein